jgi:hypothetical protein
METRINRPRTMSAKHKYYECPNCIGGDMKSDLSVQYESYPPQFDFVCDNCKYHKVMHTYEDFKKFLNE